MFFLLLFAKDPEIDTLLVVGIVCYSQHHSKLWQLRDWIFPRLVGGFESRERCPTDMTRALFSCFSFFLSRRRRRYSCLSLAIMTDSGTRSQGLHSSTWLSPLSRGQFSVMSWLMQSTVLPLFGLGEVRGWGIISFWNYICSSQWLAGARPLGKLIFQFSWVSSGQIEREIAKVE